jgi:hypothetical protein
MVRSLAPDYCFVLPPVSPLPQLPNKYITNIKLSKLYIFISNKLKGIVIKSYMWDEKFTFNITWGNAS